MASAALPERLLFVDVETTGLFSSDRVVSLGLIAVNSKDIVRGEYGVKGGHFVFDPGRKSHPRAQDVHGFDDWFLRHQAPFEKHAADIRGLFDGACVVAHNAEFDLRFLSREFELAGLPLPDDIPHYCTMQAYRSTVGGRSGLNAVLANIGLARQGKHHGAFEDAWFAMQVYYWLNALPRSSRMPDCPLSNVRDVPPRPTGALPRRKRKSKQIAPLRSPSIAAPKIQDTALYTATRPTAIILLFMARADGVVDEAEVEVLSSFVSQEMERLNMRRSDASAADVVAMLAELNPSPDLVDLAAREIVKDQYARENLGAWIRKVAYADGSGTEAERIAIARVTEAFAKAR